MPVKRLSRSVVDDLKPAETVYEVRDLALPGFLVRVQPTGRKLYVVNWSRGKRKTLGLTSVLTFDQAKARAHQMLNEVLTTGRPNLPTEADSTTFGEFIERRYGPWVTANRKDGAATLARITKCYTRDLWSKPLAEVNAWIVDKWRTRRLKAGIAAATVNRDLTALKAALAKSVEWELLAAHPLAKLRPAKVTSAQGERYLSAAEEKRLRAALEARDDRIRQERAEARRARGAAYKRSHPAIGAADYGDHLTPAVLVSLNTGLRQGELLGLTWEAVNLGRKMLTVEAQTAKSSAKRHIPLNAEALEVLSRWHRQRGEPGAGIVFPNRKGVKINEVKTAWRALLKAAKIKGFRWHDMRHHFASRLVMAGVDLNTVRELLGHADIKMTLRYAHLAPEHKAAAVEKLVAA